MPVNILLYKRDVVNVIKLRILGWENYPKLFPWAQCNHRVFYRRVNEGSESEREDVMTETEVQLGKKKKKKDEIQLALRIENVATSQEIEVAFRNWERKRKECRLEALERM